MKRDVERGESIRFACQSTLTPNNLNHVLSSNFESFALPCDSV